MRGMKGDGELACQAPRPSSRPRPFCCPTQATDATATAWQRVRQIILNDLFGSLQLPSSLSLANSKSQRVVQKERFVGRRGQSRMEC